MKSEILLSDGIIINSDYALFLTQEKVLAISDLHIGYEASLQAEGVAIPDFQFDIMLARLERLLDRYNPETVVVNGDLKHEFSRNRSQEWDEISRVIELVQNDGVEIKIVRGNHDNYLMTILAKKDIEMVDSINIGDFEFVHGHKNMSRDDIIRIYGHEPVPGDVELRVYGHEHPVVRLRDEIGAQITLPCFLYSEEYGFLIMPGFSPLAGGTNVIMPTNNFMIPELRGLDLSDARIFTLSDDGIMDFGTVEALRDLDFRV